MSDNTEIFTEHKKPEAIEAVIAPKKAKKDWSITLYVLAALFIGSLFHYVFEVL